MYASITSYADIYDQAYRDRRGTTTSFDKELLPALLLQFCESSGISSVLDVSGGQGELSRTLRSHGLTVVTTDLEANAEAGILALNLSETSESKTQEVLTQAGISFRGGTYITTCFDVLEHIDIEHVFNALKNLRSVCAEKLVLSISTRPSSFYNRFHSTLLPIRTWVRLFSEVGFRVLETNHFQPATFRRILPKTPELEYIHRWRAVDLFADIDNGEPQYLLLEKSASVLDWPRVQDRFSRILDIKFRAEKRRHFKLPDDERICFNIGFSAEWALVRPYLDILPRSQVEFLVRTTYLDTVNLNVITGWLTRVGVRHTLFQYPNELQWDRLAGATVVSAAESSAHFPHIRAHHVVAAARLHGCRTITLQHGIWPSAIHGRVVTHAAEHLLNWSTEEARALREGRHKVLGVDVPWGAFSEGQVKEIGSARYTDQLLEPGDDLIETRLGIDRSRFERVVLIGLKDLKNQGHNNINAGFLNELTALIKQNTSTLFLLRPHPFDSISAYTDLRGKNVRLLDHVCCTMADLQLSRLIPHVDVVITPMSTLVLDAAVSGKPVFISSTDRPLIYKGAKPRKFEDFTGTMDDASQLAILKSEATEIAAVYADAVDDQFYERFLELLKQPKPAGPPDAFLAATVSLCDEAESLEHRMESLQAEVATLKREFETSKGRLQAEIATLKRELETSRGHLDAIFRSRSWILARALQKVAAGGRRIFRLN